MRLSFLPGLVFLAAAALLVRVVPVEAHQGHQSPPPSPTGAEVTEKERLEDASFLRAIQSGTASEKEIEVYTDQLFARDGERVSVVTQRRVEVILDAALSVEKYRRSKVVWHQWGAILFEGGYFDSAIRAFNRVLKLDPGFLPSLLGTGTAYLARGKVKRATWRLLRAVQAVPGEPLGWFHLMQAILGISPDDPSRTGTETKNVLAAFALLRFEALFREPLPQRLVRWKADYPEALREAGRLTTEEFLKEVSALVPSIQQALANARKGGISFREAQQFEELRVEFVSHIERQVRPRMGRYFAGLVYDPDRFRFVRSLRESVSRLPWRNDRERIRSIIRDARQRGSGAIVITLEEELGSGRPSRIFILDQMFETPSIASEGDLISALVNHERIHVNHVGEGIRLRSGRRIDARNFTVYHEVDLKIPERPPVKTVVVAPEVLAYAEELRQSLAGKAGVTPLYIRSAVSNFWLMYGLLERIAASGISPDDQFARELAKEVGDVAEDLRARFPLLSRGVQIYPALDVRSPDKARRLPARANPGPRGSVEIPTTGISDRQLGETR